MKAHNLEVIGGAILSYTPSDPNHAVRLQDIQALTGDGNPVFITDITPSGAGIVAAKQYEPNIVPANAVISSAITDTQNVRIHFIAEGGPLKYSPSITIDGGPADSISEISGDKRLFSGYRDIVITESKTITVSSDTGASDTVSIVLASEGPSVQSATIGNLPGSQTEVKQNDQVPFTGVVSNDAVEVEVKNFGAASDKVGNITIGADDSGGAGFKTFSGVFRVSNRSGSLKLRVSAKNFLGTEGATTDSTNSVTLNQTFPTVPAISVSYPASQSALKGSEQATVTSNVTNADEINYSFSNGTVENPTTIETNKTVTRTSGTYVTGNNYTIVATKTSNDATTTRNGVVRIADAAPTAAITISGNPSRLRSSASGQDYTIVVDPNQDLNGPPTLDASIGDWQGSWTSAGGDRWQRTLRILDSHPKGSGVFSNLVLTNLANVQGNTITSGANYTVGGLTFREITFPAFARYAPIGTSVANINKTTAKYSGAEDNLTLRNDTNDVSQSYTIVDAAGLYDPNGDHLYISDAAFAGSNTSGTLKLDFEEVV